MKSKQPLELDPEFEVLPYEERRDATELKFLYSVRRKTAERSRRIRNGLGVTSMLALSGLEVAHHIEGVNFNTASSVATGISFGLLMRAVSKNHNQANREDELADYNAEVVAEMFNSVKLEPPTWTQEVRNT